MSWAVAITRRARPEPDGAVGLIESLMGVPGLLARIFDLDTMSRSSPAAEILLEVTRASAAFSG
jgi:hypothetical protein